MEALVAERTANGPFTSLLDFASRLDMRVMNKRQLENLARAGAFDSLNPNRQQVFQSVELLIRHASAAQKARESRQVSLFGDDSAAIMSGPMLPEVVDWLAREELQPEFDATGRSQKRRVGTEGV